MTTTLSQTAISPVRDRTCPLCDAAPGQPCQPQPAADHLARWLSAYTAGHLTKAYMAMAVGELVVIDACAVVEDQAPDVPASVRQLLDAGHTLTYAPDSVWDGCYWAELRDSRGHLVECGNGTTRAAAAADLARRLGGAR